MYVCICNAITDREVRTLVEEGSRTVGEVYRGLGCQPQCCKCVADMRRLIEGSEALALLGTPHN